jgi:peptidoglycan/xylan/chitin deacetylase (PgdA/CDA1 family)
MNFRLDRLVTLYLVSPILRLASEDRHSIPILMYHSITDDDESRGHAYYRTGTSPKAFASQMEQLHLAGYQTCSPAQAVAQLQAKATPASKQVVITFDDGYSDFYQKAFPLLNQFGFTATVYLPTAYIGESPLQFKGRDCLTWSEVRELENEGILFGSHTVTHPQLSGLSKDAVKMEITDSRKSIEDKTGHAVDSFAYPYAFPQADSDFRKMLRDTLVSAGYRNGVCTTVGRTGYGSDPLFMERLPMNDLDDKALLEAKLAGAYDWISKPQAIMKAAKTRAVRIFGKS